MPEAPAPATDPRWGQVDRDRKAEAILRTVEIMAPDRDVRHGTWLDIGCGSGGIAATLAQHVDRVIGVDPESWERWNQFRAEHSNLSLQQGSYRDIETSCGSNSIDVVVCNQVYEHVDDPVALITAIHRVLKPGGVCYFAGPNLLWPIEPHVFWPFVHWLPRGFAQALMRAVGSRHAAQLDAYSTHYWRLRGWFHEAGLVPRNAIAARIKAGFVVHGTKLQLPAPLGTMINALAPLSPGFVFALRKQ